MTVTLYQFELCPYCHKVKAGLELKGIPYRRVEVNPLSKSEIKHFPEAADGRKKVPLVEIGDQFRRESSDILRWLDEVAPGDRALLPSAESAERADAIDTWVDKDLIQILPTVLYGTWGESIRAAKLTAKTSNFSRLDNLKVSMFGSVVMKMIAKRILKKRGEGRTGPELFEAQLDQLETYLGDDDFLCGDQPNLADAGVHGALTCVREFPAFERVQARPNIMAWYERVGALRRHVDAGLDPAAAQA
ncbi:MAG: microsomal prostaglandin-E synthase 2 [Myxococcota bacterium]